MAARKQLRINTARVIRSEVGQASCCELCQTERFRSRARALEIGQYPWLRTGPKCADPAPSLFETGTVPMRYSHAATRASLVLLPSPSWALDRQKHCFGNGLSAITRWRNGSLPDRRKQQPAKAGKFIGRNRLPPRATSTALRTTARFRHRLIIQVVDPGNTRAKVRSMCC